MSVPGLRQQRLAAPPGPPAGGSRCSGGAVGRRERLLQERHADAFGPAHVLQRGRRPRPALHHLGEQGQAHARPPCLPAPARPRPGPGTPRCSLSASGGLGSLPKARPKAASTLRAWSASNRSARRDVAAPRRSRTSSSRRNRLTASQKSSRTMTTHCTRPPSHCRRACASSVFGSLLAGRAATARTGRARAAPSAPAAGRGRGAGRRATPSGPCRTAGPGSTCAGRRAAGPRSPRRSPRRRRRCTASDSRGSRPALTSDDLPQPDGP